MKNLKLWQKAGLASILAAALVAGPMPGIKAKHDSKPSAITLSVPSAQSAEIQTQELKGVSEKDLEQLTMYCLVHGKQNPTEPMKYIELWNKTEKGQRKVYFEVFYTGSEKGIVANKIRFVETEYIPSKIDKDTPHGSLITEDFSPYIGKDMVTLNQKMITDGGGYGTLDGKADIMMERTSSITPEGVVLNIGEDIEIQDKEKIKKSYEGYVKEFLQITGTDDIKPEAPKPKYEVQA
ncbi:hypothetical protein FJZ53_07445 [Candidatus Woesearchaeota archaeon]|nr:hypothetical protein [Candidatus Woesearchaeota archaeon]